MFINEEKFKSVAINGPKVILGGDGETLEEEMTPWQRTSTEKQK